jgi:hypothetical protein
VVAAGPSPILSEEFAVGVRGSRDSASPWGGLSRQPLVQDRRDATDLLPTSLFPSSLAATLHPAASDNGRLGYSLSMPLDLSLILAPGAFP